MSFEQIVATTFVAFMLVTWITLLIKASVALFKRIKMEHQYLNHPHVVEYSILKACSEPHAWVDTTLALRHVAPGEYKVCVNCGSICGNNEYMVSDHALKQMTEALKVAEEQMKIERAFIARINDLADAYIDQYIESEFAVEINDESFHDKLWKLVSYAFEAQKAAKDKVLAEDEGQTELDKRYETWGGKIKGNA